MIITSKINWYFFCYKGSKNGRGYWKMELFQHTLADTVVFEGEGVISGKQITVELIPSPPNQGIIFERVDLDPPVLMRVSPETVFAMEGATLIRQGEGQIIYIEHLLSALNGLAIDNVIIRVNGPEIPLLDGSARPYVEAILKVGRKPQWSLRRYLRILGEFEVKNGVGRVAFRPASELKIHCEIDFPHPVIGHQETSLSVTQETYISELSYARTFGFLSDIIEKKKKGIFKGGSLENAIILDQERVLNPDGLRRPDEFVRHKALDLVGDLYLLGAPILGEISASRSSHRLHLKALKALLQKEDCWAWFPGPVRVPVRPVEPDLNFIVA